ncbi:MAG TPA: choice-of-anchor D domain-containing protein [Candidatus Acidoferrales bacterium]|jgi:sugar lactone lactonase YvrE|nr:choice-of-anchor D domain-containing protein [Candidatus Acidoferrales bacterium]
MRNLRKLALVGLSVAFCSLSAQAQQTINTVAGGGPNNLPALSASIGIPVGISEDSAGNVYIADAHCNCVFTISTGGQLAIFAGNGAPGYSGDGGTPTTASLNSPAGVFVDSAGNVFIADSGNNVIREVPNGGKMIQTVVGNGTAGFVDGVAPLMAELSDPTGVYVDSTGDIFIADSGNNVIREMAAGATPMVTTIAGNHALGAGYNGDNILATNAKLNNPKGVYLDTAGTVFVADTGNNRIRTVVVGANIQTIAGTGVAGESGDGGPATSAELNGPTAIFVSGSFSASPPTGQLYIADTNTDAIREVIATLPANLETIHTVAGNGLPGFTGDGGKATSAELFLPRGVFVDSSQNIFISDTGNSFVREVSALTGDIFLVGGNGTAGFSGDSSTATDAALNLPAGVSTDGAGDIFIADTANNAIREVVSSTGLMQTVAGRGGAACNFSGNGVSATQSALLCNPSSVVVDGFGNIFIADTGNHVVREVVFNTGNIQTVAGIGGNAGFSGDGGFAIQAQLHSPAAVFVDGAGNIFVADTGNNAIREVVAATGKIATVAGDHALGAGYSGDNGLATLAQLNAPAGLYLDGFGDIFIADTANNVIREVVGGVGGKIFTVAGDFALGPGYSGDNGSPTAAQLNGPKGVLIDPSGNLFIADTNNEVIREVPLGAGSNIETIAGNNVAAFGGDGGVPTKASLHSPIGLALDRLGGIYIADSANDRIRDASGLAAIGAAKLSTQSLTFNNQVITTTSASQPVMLTNTGSAPLAIFAITTTGTNGTSFGQNNNCGSSLPVNGNCTINVTFTPLATGALVANLSISDSSASSPQLVALTGTGVSPVVLNPTGVSFPLQINGSSSQPQTITLTNNQTVALNFTSIAISGINAASFQESNTCGASVPAGGTCSASVIFDPNTTGSNSANLVFTDNAPGGSQTAALFGLGTAATADLSPTTLTFPTTMDLVASPTQNITLTNNGKDVLNVTGFTFTGTNSTDFTQTNTCGVSVLASANCVITVTFTPQAGGTRTAVLNIADSAGNSPQLVPLSGVGLDFQIIVDPNSSATATVTAGSAANYVLDLSAVGGSASTDTIKVTLTCGALPAGTTCTFPTGTLSVTPTTSASLAIAIGTTAAKTATGGPGSRIRTPIMFLFVVCFIAFLCWLVTARSAATPARRKALGMYALAIIAIALCVSTSLIIGCQAPAAQTTSGPSGVTPAGTYNPTITGTSGNDVHTLTLTLIVQ